MRVLAAFLILLVACGLPAAADPYDELSRIPADQVLVDFKDDVPLADVHQMAAAAGVMLEPVSPESVADRLFQGSVPPARMDAVVAAFSADPRVESAEPNAYMAGLWKDEDVLPLDQIKRLAPTRSFKPNDPLYKYQWHMHKIGMEAAWVGSTGRDAIVAVIDTGVAYEDYQKFMLVEDLKGIRFVKGWNYIGNNEHANDDHAHGTHVAGTIAQATNNGVGVTGIAFNCSIMPLKVLSARGFGSIGDIAAAIRFAANHGANVINMSLGGPSSAKALESAVQYAHKKGVVVVCAAGNNGTENVSYPARYKECIAVSATRFDDQLTFYTNKGKRIDIAAPGGDMNVDQNDDGYRDGVLQNTIAIGDPTQQAYSLFQGTSMASPHVAGVAAALVSLGITEPEAVRARLVSTARKEGIDDLDKGYGGGVLEASKAVYRSAVLDPAARLVLGVGVLIAMMLFSVARPRPTVLMLLGLTMGASGLFFLPYLGLNVPLLSHPLADWDLCLVGTFFHANPLFWSALIPLGIAIASFGQRRMHNWALGLALGTAAFLLHQVLYTTADIQAIPGLLLDKAWLLLNAGACVFLAYVLAYARISSAAQPKE